MRNANDGATALLFVSGRRQFSNGQLQILRLLLDANANVNAKDNNGYTALIKASNRGNIDVVRVLLDAKAEVNIRGIDVLLPHVGIARRTP